MTRRVIIFVCALVALSGALVAAAATLNQRDHDLRGYVNPTQTTALPFRIPRLGVNAELTQYTPIALGQHLDLMAAANITWVRQFLPWDQIEPEPGVYNWSVWDRLIDAVAQYPTLELVAVLNNSPAWARTSPDPTAPPDDPNDFAAFVTRFAERYQDRIDHYQIWDEPNLHTAWGGLDPRPSHYLALLAPAYAAIHATDPQAHVLAAALAPTIERGPQNISDLLYLEYLYRLGGAAYTDAIAAKPYGFDHAPDDRTVADDRLNFSRIVALREIMSRYGDAHTALWAASWGWNSLPDDWSGSPSIWGQVSPEQRSDYTNQALIRAEHEWPWIGGMILYHWQPDAPEDDPVWGFSLLQPDGSPTPLWQQLMVHQRNTATNGLYAARNPFARYSGVWTFGPLGADIGWINDSQVRFDFAGREVALLVRQDDYVAYLYPHINGEPAPLPPRDNAGNAYIILTSDTLEPVLNLVPLAHNLPDGDHTLHIVADDLVPDEATDRYALVGYAVSSGDLAAPYNRQLGIAALTATIAGLAVIVTGIPVIRSISPLLALWRSFQGATQLGISIATSCALMIGMFFIWGTPLPALFRPEPVQLGLAIITAGIVYLQPGFLLTIISLIILFFIFYHRPDFGLALTIFWSPFFLFPVELYRFAFPMAELTILVTGVAWSLRALAHWGRHRQSHIPQFATHLSITALRAIDWAMLLWVGLGVLALAWSQYRSIALTDLRVMILEPALFYLVFRLTDIDRSALMRLVDALLLSGIVISVIGIWMFFQGDSIITAEGGTLRLASVYGSPNNLGLFLGRCLPFALAFALIPTDTRRRWLTGAGFSVMLVAAVLTQSAGAIFVGIPAGIIAVLVLVWRRRALAPLAALAALGGAAFVVALQSPRFARLLDFSTGTNFARLRVWESAMNIIRDFPLTGIGLDQFLYFFRGRYILPDAWQEPDLSHPHNILLDYWLRHGILGVMLLLFTQFAFWRSAFAAYRSLRHADPILFAIIIGAMASMINLLAHGLIDNSVFVQDLTYIFVLLMSLAVYLSNTRAIDAEQSSVL